MLKRNPLRPFMNLLEKLFLPVQSVCIYASIATIFVTVLVREVFRSSIVWGYEIASFFVIVLLFLGMPAALHHDSNLRVTILYDLSPPVVKKALKVLYFLLEVMVLIMMAAGFNAYMSKLGHTVLAACKFPNWLYYGTIGIGVWLSLLELLTEALDLFVKKPDLAQKQDARRTDAVTEGSKAKEGAR